MGSRPGCRVRADRPGYRVGVGLVPGEGVQGEARARVQGKARLRYKVGLG